MIRVVPPAKMQLPPAMMRVVPPACPVKFAVDVLLMKTGRQVSEECARELRYPLAGPVDVRDWYDFLPLVVSPSDLFLGRTRLRDTLYRELEAQVLTGDPRMVMVGTGFLARIHGGAEQAARLLRPDLFLLDLCGCMNRASDLLARLHAQGPAWECALAECHALGSNLASVCVDHGRLVELFKQHMRAQGTANVEVDPPRRPCSADVDPGRGGFARVQRRAAEGVGGLPVAVPVRAEDGQGSPTGICVEPGAPQGSDLAFLSPAQGHWRQDLLRPPARCGAGAGGTRKRQGGPGP